MNKRVFVTGTGIISSIGNNKKENLESLLSEKTGIGEITLLDTIHKGKIPVAEVKLTTPQLLTLLGAEGKKNLTRTAILGIMAAREAILDAGLNPDEIKKAGLVSATTVGGMDRSENFYSQFLDNNSKGRLIDIVNHDCGDSTERIAEYTGLKGFITTISTACSSSANSILFGARLIQSGIAERVIAGGTDSLTKFTLNGFNTLMILDKNGCKPFDDERAGLTLGEGAAFLVLESEEAMRKRNRKALCELSGCANANDAYHQTASSPDGNGACLAMQAALDMSGIKPQDISYINVHGTGTQNNDLSEGIALEKIFGNKVPPFSSTKTFTGHTLGAAGAVEAVFCMMAIQQKVIFPNLRFKIPMKEINIQPVTTLIRNMEIEHVLSNSFGFGGNNSTLIFSKAEK
ncbi:MAG: beta-ketoacyl-[acyl-carrier-protein] synthase family protein [Bacteroidota bacterium]|nr:beta-ketoacyl-[acyl-carrier-protein] synthase family protein [Bacteroidota bacterium]